jgi:hypothetical protein
MKHFWGWMGANHEQLKIVCAICAATFVLVEYLGKVNEGAVAKTLDYVKRFNEADVAEARRKLDAFWDRLSVEAWRERLNQANFERVVPDLIRESGLTPEVRVLGHFYREVGLCVQGKVCNAAKACHFFFSDIRGYQHNYKWYLDEAELRNEGTPTILSGMMSEACSAQHRDYCAKNPRSPYCTGGPLSA